MKYSKDDIINVATKLGRLANGGVVGYYAGGKTSEIMSNTIPNELVSVVERHKKVQLGASLAQSFIPGAGIVATSAAVASLWKMYYDINQVLSIKISDNVGKSLTSAVLTNLSSTGAQIGATAVSEGAKFIPFVGWIASAAISTVTTTAIVYGAAYLYLTALTKMYEAEGKFDLDYLTSSLEDEDYNSEYEVDDDDEVEDEAIDPLVASKVRKVKQIIGDQLGYEINQIISTNDLEDEFGATDEDKQNIIDELEDEFGISITKGVEDFTFVDDFIECVIGESIWEEDDKYDGEDDDQVKMYNETIERFNAFFKSYVNDEYKDMEITKLANMFENEAIKSPNSIIQSQYYCLAAVSRLEFFLKEWFDNGFENYSVEEQVNKLNEQCITNGIDNIQKALSLLPNDKEYLLIYAILNMLNDYYVECKEDKDEFNKKYAHYADECKDCDNTMFNMEWLVGLYNKVYDCLLTCFDTEASEESVDDNDAEEEYLDNIREFLEDDAEITPRERKMLDRIRQKLGISEERAKELEASLAKPQLTDDEQEYLDMYREYAEKGDVTEKKRRRLDKFAAAMGVTAERVKEIEKLA